MASREDGKIFQARHIENGPDVEKVPLQDVVKVDGNGLPLVPQPSRFKDDPLNWPRWLKWTVLIQVSFMAFLGPFVSGLPNPSLVTLGHVFHRSTIVVTYSTTLAIIMGGVASFIWTPLTNIYGRRPITLLSQLFAMLGSIGSATCRTYSGLLGTRALNGIGMAGMMSVGTACVNDMFFLHERGEKTGIYTIFVTNGGHIAFLFGGILAERNGWQWDFWLSAIVTGASMFVAIFLFPETLFSRGPNFLAERTHERTYWEMLFNLKANMIPQRKLRAYDFVTSFIMLKYPSVAFSFWYYTWSFTFVNILPAVSFAKIYTEHYHFGLGAIGLSVGIPLTIGCVLGELTAGKLSDYIMYRLAKRNDGIRKPEHRLLLTGPSAFLMPAGIIIFGWCVQEKKQWVVPLVGLAIGSFGLQVTSTCLYSYVSDCYKAQTPETAVLMNLSRGLSFCIGFFGVLYGEKVGFGWAWTTYALVLFVFWFPILGLMFWGEGIRAKLGKPKFHQYV